MKANIELPLRTREVYQLFQRKINGDRLFIEAILHKFNTSINCCTQQNPSSPASYKQIERTILELTHQFANDITRFETLLTKKKIFEYKNISYIIKFRPVIIVTNPLAVQLIEFIEIYDRLISILKLLHLAGCFESNAACFNNIRRYQKMANQMLSTIVLTPTPIISSEKINFIVRPNFELHQDK